MTCNLNHGKMVTPFLSRNRITIYLRNIGVRVKGMNFLFKTFLLPADDNFLFRYLTLLFT